MVDPRVRRLPGFRLASQAYWAQRAGRDRVRTRRVARMLGDRSRVAAGPFEGMRYLPEAHGSQLLPKLVGSYEAEVEHVIRAVIAAAPQVVVDLGAAEGYYAVGLARALPQAVVHAFEIDPRAVRACRALTRINGVEGRVHLHGEATPAALNALALAGAFVLSDVEGAERDLLDPAAVPGLLDAELLVEMHDWLSAGTTAAVTSRFADTHAVTLIASTQRDGGDFSAVAHLPAPVRLFAVDERRPPQVWAHLRPAS